MSIFKSHIDMMSPYKPPLDGRDPSRYALLDFNERTIPVASAIAQDIADWVVSGRLQMYPSYGNVTEQIADYCGVSPHCVMLTNGSDQGLDLAFRASCISGSEVIIPGPTFPIYLQSAMIENAKIHEPQYTREGGYPVDDVLALVNENTRVIVVANPNNPSGTSVAREDIVRLAQASATAIVLVDECYFEYCQITVTDLVEQYPNIVITRTFSKTWGLPSLRVGYVVSAVENIDALLKVRGPYDVNQLATVAICSAFKHRDSIDAYIQEVMKISKPMLEAFLDKNNVCYWPSAANFIWAFFDEPEHVEGILRGKGILVRPKTTGDGVMGLRITLGTEEQTSKLIDAIRFADSRMI